MPNREHYDLEALMLPTSVTPVMAATRASILTLISPTQDQIKAVPKPEDGWFNMEVNCEVD